MCCFGGSGEGYPLLELLGVYCGSEIGSTMGMSDGIIYGKIGGSFLGEWTFGSETRSEVSSSGRFSYGGR